MLADDGRKSLGDEVRKRLAAGERVIALDPFDFGESKALPHLVYPILVAALGDRPLGIEAAQVGAAARWARARQEAGPATLLAAGPRTSLVATVAAVWEDGVGRLELSHSLPTLRQVIDKNREVNEGPELFCFGLLAEFDVATILSLAAAREITLRDVDRQSRDAFAPLCERLRLAGKTVEIAAGGETR